MRSFLDWTPEECKRSRIRADAKMALATADAAMEADRVYLLTLTDHQIDFYGWVRHLSQHVLETVKEPE